MNDHATEKAAYLRSLEALYKDIREWALAARWMPPWTKKEEENPKTLSVLFSDNSGEKFDAPILSVKKMSDIDTRWFSPTATIGRVEVSGGAISYALILRGEKWEIENAPNVPLDEKTFSRLIE